MCQIDTLQVGKTTTPVLYVHMDVSKNSGTSTPKSSIFKGFSIINHPFWGTPIFGNTYIVLVHYWGVMLCFSWKPRILCSCAHHKSCLAGPQPLKMSQQHATDHIQEFMQIRDIEKTKHKTPQDINMLFWGEIVAPPFGQKSANKNHQWTSSSTGGAWTPESLRLRFLQLGTHLAAPWMPQLGLSLGPPMSGFWKILRPKSFP